MALIIKDRVKEITTTTGTGDVSLGGASATFDAFQSVMSNGDTTFYAIVHTASGTDEWEVGVGTWNTGNTLTRTTIYAGSNGTSAVNFSSGNKDIFMTYPASKAAVAGEDVTFADITATDITSTGTVTLSADPSSALQAATKQYVDTIAAAGIHYHAPVRVEHPSNLNATYNNGSSGVGATLTNAGTNAALVLDNVSMVLNDRVLVANQTDQTQNGVYTVTTVGDGSTAWVLTRSTDTDSYAPSDGDSLGEGDAFFIKEGDTNAGHLDVMTTSGTITFGTTNIVFSEVAETSIYSAGTGLTLTGTTFSTNQDISTSASPTFNNITVTGTVDGRDVATDGSKLDGIEAGATADQTAAEIKTAYESNSNTNAFTDAEKTKLSGIETGATGDQTASEILTAIKTVDGAASGLDADLLDGQQGSYYLNTGTTFSGDVSGTYNNIVVANDSHTHDGRYYTETEADSRFANVTGDTFTGALNIETTGGPALTLKDTNGAGTAAAIYIDFDDSAGNRVGYVGIGSGGTNDNWFYSTSGKPILASGNGSAPQYYNGSTYYNIFHDGYHPNADKWTTARTLSLSGDASGSVSWDGSANATLSVTVADDSHNHTIANVDGLQTALDAKLASSSYTAADVLTKIKTVDGSGSGLDADTLDGYHLSTTRNAANTVPVRNSSGYLDLGWINTTSGVTTATIDKIYASNDNYIRYITPATLISQLNLSTTSHNHTYDVNNSWLRDNGDNANVKLYGNSRQMAFRTDGTTEYSSGVGSYPFAWMYGGDASGNRRMLLSTVGDLWTSANGWLSTALSGKLSTSGKAADSNLLDGIDSSSFLRSDAADTASGDITFTGGAGAISVGAGSDLRFTTGDWTGEYSGKIQYHSNHFYFQSANQWIFRNSSAVNVMYGDQSGNWTAVASLRSPIFYDTNDTSRYIDPKGDSYAGDYYNVDGWFRNYGQRGLYNQDTNSHFFSAGSNYWHINSGNTTSGGLIFYKYYNATQGNSTNRYGYVYWDSSGFGLLSADGSWAVQTDNSKTQIHHRLDTPIMYDKDNTAYYVDPASTGISINVRGEIQNPSVWINDGDNYNNYNENIRLFASPNNGVAVIAFRASGTGGLPDSSILGFSDRHEVRWGGQWQTRVYNGYEEAYGSYRAPIFYDSNNTSYYVDPASTSRVNTLWASTGATGGKVNIGGTSSGSAMNINFDQIWTASGNLHLQYNGSGNIDMNNGGGYTYSRTSLRAPIFYDYNNTGYYVDPASTSVLNNLTVNGTVTGISASATGGGSDEIFWENGQTVTTNYTITNGKNAMSAGPITVNSGVTVTVGSGETWTVV